MSIAALVVVLVAAGLELGPIADNRQRRSVAVALTGGDPARAPALIRRYGCAGCHTVPGVAGADGKVAPPLADLRERVFIAGVARHTPEALIRWIVAPQSLSPHSAMPATGITEAEARDVAAYLYAN
ncbi:MAG: cytochrome c [Hyphomicrobiales bacterium]|nr:cytochrome c [Hyphomicrobiales bacterium]